MVLLGVDPHKDTHTVVAVDPAGRQLGQITVAARSHGHAKLLGWARHRWPERLWAVEDCRHVTGRLEADLLAAGERVVRVPPRLMAGARQAVRALGKSDPIDALAVARAAPGRTRPARCRPRPGLLGGQAAGRPPRAAHRRADPDDQPAALAPAPARP
jgi:transposase